MSDSLEGLIIKHGLSIVKTSDGQWLCGQLGNDYRIGDGQWTDAFSGNIQGCLHNCAIGSTPMEAVQNVIGLMGVQAVIDLTSEHGEAN